MDESETQWLSLCAQFEKLHRNLSAAQPFSAEGRKDSEFRSLLRRWWASIEAMLTFYVEKFCSGAAPPSLPVEIVNAFKQFAGYLAVGSIPGMIADVAAKGSWAPGPTETRDICLAVAYIAAAKTGIEHCGERIAIDDKAPVKTVCSAFGVSPSTVQGWQQKYEPGGLGVTPINAGILKNLMKDAGGRYCSAGRSHLAIRNRRPKK
jgi:hypothetical protein